MSSNLPTGTVTFLFTDIEGSTHLWERYPEAMKAALARHDGLLRQAIEQRTRHQNHQRRLPRGLCLGGRNILKSSKN